MFLLILPVSNEPYQVMYVTAAPDGHAFSAKAEIRYLPGPDRWFLSVSDAATGEMYVNQIPLVCSYTYLNDLFYPFRYLFRGAGIGSFFVVEAVDPPSTTDPTEGNLSDFQLIWTDQDPLGKGE